jgi:alpha-1,2-mannosyltransferase
MSRLFGWRHRLQGLTFALLAVLAVNQFRIALEAWGIVFRRPGFADFGNYYLYAQVGLHQSWNHLYDLAAQRQEWLRLGGADVIPWFPIIYPPPLPWLVVPFTLLSLPVAFACWTALLLGCVLLGWRLVVPRGSRLVRWTALAAMLAVFPVLYALILGQVLILELGAVAAAWWFASRGREIPAGILLTALVFKPQVAILVPVVLLVIGRWRTVAVWLAGSALIATISLITTGIDGLHNYASRLSDAAATAPEFLVPTQFTIAGFLGHGMLTLTVAGLLVALTMAVAYRHRREGPALPLACALVGSMLVTPYLHSQDLATLLLAGGIALHGRLDRWQYRLLIGGYALLLAISYWGFGRWGPILGAMLLLSETVWLLAALRVRTSGSAVRLSHTFGQVPLDRTA